MSTAAMNEAKKETLKTYELKITRVFDAPRELVWRAWTDPDIRKQWMGPRGFRTTELVWPMVVGGTWRRTMVGCRPGSEDEVTLKQHGTVREVKPPELLVFTFAWDERSKVGLEESPFKENTVTVRLEEKERKTVMTFTQGPFAAESERDGHNGGWNSAFDRFAEFLLAEQPGRVDDPNDVSRELHLKRIFAAPRQVVFDAWVKPEIVAEWWGPKHFTSTVKAWDVRGGGEIHVVMHSPEGVDYPMGGKFIEVYPPYRFHFTTTALDKDGSVIFENWNSVFFEEVDGGTRITLDVHVVSETENAETYLKGMREGWSLSLDKLEELLVKQ